MIGTLEIHNLKCQLFFAEVFGITKNHIESNLAESRGLLARNDSIETHVACAESGHRNAHPFQCLCVQYIQTTAAIHQHFSQSSTFDDWVDHQSLPPRGGYVRRVI